MCISGLAPHTGMWEGAKERTGKGTREEAPKTDGREPHGQGPLSPDLPLRPLQAPEGGGQASAPTPGTQPSRWGQDAARGGLARPCPDGAPEPSPSSCSLPWALQSRLRDPRPSRTALWAFPCPSSVGRLVPTALGFLQRPSLSLRARCPPFGELDKEIGKTFKLILSSSLPSLP